MGAQIAIEDLWKTYFCVATNYSQAREQQVRSGDLARALLASIAIPGALPPVVHDGDLLCDGGTFNNFPVDLMRDMRGVGTVIGVDLGARNPRRLEFDEVPGTWTLLRDPSAATQQAALPPAIADRVPAQRDHFVQHIAPAAVASADRPVLQSTAAQDWTAAMVTLRPDRDAGARSCGRGARRVEHRAAFCAWHDDVTLSAICPLGESR